MDEKIERKDKIIWLLNELSKIDILFYVICMQNFKPYILLYWLHACIEYAARIRNESLNCTETHDKKITSHSLHYIPNQSNLTLLNAHKKAAAASAPNMSGYEQVFPIYDPNACVVYTQYTAIYNKKCISF